jgi:thymidylate synthase
MFDVTYRAEAGYKTLLWRVLNQGVEVKNERTGTMTKAIFDAKFVLGEGEFMFSTSRPAPLRLAFLEFWSFLLGELDTKKLEDKGVNFWRGNTSREFLDSRGLDYLPEGSLGKAYSFQFRNAGGDFNEDYTQAVGGVDQLKRLYEGLRDDSYGRRHLLTLWNPMQSDEMCLTACWFGHLFMVLPDREGNNVLHMKLYNRSLDVLFGFLFAVQQYRLYQMAMAKLLGMKLGKLSCDLTNVHLYQNQYEYAQEAIDRAFGVQGTLEITKELNTLDDLLNMKWEDIKVEGLIVNKEPFKTPRPPMVA